MQSQQSEIESIVSANKIDGEPANEEVSFEEEEEDGEPANKVIFFKEEILVEKSSADSAQSVVYFGEESTMGIRVVLKQYLNDSFQSLFRELKIFTLIQEYKKNNND